MKILHLCDSLNPAGLGGYESYLHYLIPELEERGHQSFVVSQTPDKGALGNVEAENYTTFYLKGNLLEARKWEFYKHPVHEREKIARKLFKRDDLQENVELLSDEFLSLLHDHRPDIIHAHSTYVVFNRVLQQLRCSGRLEGISLLATIHGRPKKLILPGQVETTDYVQFANSCPFDRVLAVSKNVENQLRRHLENKPSVPRIETLYLGVNLDVFNPRSEAEKQWDVAFLGRLEPMKSVDLLPEMVSLLASEYPDISLLITGEGSLKKRILDEFEQRGVASLIDYQGVVPSEQVIGLIQSSRVVLYPSREEPFGLAIVEAMACGVPVIATNLYGPSEILTHLHDGYLIDATSAQELAQAVSFFLENRELREKMGTTARKTAEQRFDLKEHVDKLESIYAILDSNDRL